jgi:hypothetical protein
LIGTQIIKRKGLSKSVLLSLSSFNYLPFDLVVLAVLPPLFFGGGLLLIFADAVIFALFDDEAEDFADFPPLPPDEPPALFAFDEEDFPSPPPLSPSIKLSTASATTLIADSAAPVAAPVRISPAASLTASKTGDDSFLVDFFDGEEDFDFVEAEELFAVDFAGDEAFLASDFDFAEVELLAVDFDFAGVLSFVVDFSFSFFVAIFHLPLFDI